MPDDDLERLRIHRELQLLRAAAWRPKRGQGQRKREWMRERVRKLNEVERKQRKPR
jgi:hypothetical protein